jgi:hypothetical protein
MDLLVPHSLPFAVVLDDVSRLGGSLLVMTGVLAGAFRSWAILIKLPPDRIEWLTAVGFAVGVFVTILFVFVSPIWR